ncbi:hypothetical protein L6452_09653 [Arctium lappa]|uniref:Uncharacterized protein n=1 Tax=Arctium lappa TaxID=4217 RepID=A0ACB9DKW4_ARCLA|nr:hypothetical protein L6452_09653 [Arctium lappa]
MIKLQSSTDTVVNQTIKDGDTIVSAGQTFEMGFFSPGTSNNRYVGIWINEAYGSPDNQPVVLIDRPVARYKKYAYYSLGDCCIMNVVPLAPSIFDFGDKFNRKSCQYVFRVDPNGYPQLFEMQDLVLAEYGLQNFQGSYDVDDLRSGKDDEFRRDNT